MNYWNQLPLFRLLLPLIFGVLTSMLLPFSEVGVNLALLISILLFSLVFLFKKIMEYTIETEPVLQKVHSYITDRKGKDYAPTTREMQKVYNLHFKK